MEKFGTKEFNQFSGLIYKQFGIYYGEAKRDILRTKIDKLMSRYNMKTYEECYGSLIHLSDDVLFNDFSNEITVNYTSFFREAIHFNYVRENAAKLCQNRSADGPNNEIRIWSAACSSGEEPYTLAMVLREALPAGVGIRILATDINQKVLATAQQGLYPSNIKYEIDPYYLKKYFCTTTNGYLVSEEIRTLVSFRQFNLTHEFPFRGTFHMVFCRNVMIYFDAAVRQELVNKFNNILRSGGLLFVGHSESLAGQTHKFRYVQPAVYAKV